MKREIGAALLLLALIAASVWNIRRADRLTGEILEHLELSERAMLAADTDYAEEQFEAAKRLWLSARSYTRVFLRHPELDAASDMFYELMQELQRGEIRALPAVYARLRYRLDCIREMEHPGWGTVF